MTMVKRHKTGLQQQSWSTASPSTFKTKVKQTLGGDYDAECNICAKP